jgi:hypothetical protein
MLIQLDQVMNDFIWKLHILIDWLSLIDWSRLVSPINLSSRIATFRKMDWVDLKKKSKKVVSFLKGYR